MKKIYRYILISVLGVMGMSSCVDNLLDRTPIASLSLTTFYQDENQCRMALMGVYSALQPVTSTYWYQLDFMSDDAYCQDSWQGSTEFGGWKQNSSSTAANDRWRMNYRLIVRANMFMTNLQVAPISESVKTQMMAEAKFLRAYGYADLITFFGDVPIVDESQTLENAYVKRMPKSEVLDYLLKDLDAAVPNLPLKYSGTDVGRASQGAALALKCRILLRNEKWADAATAAKEVMDLGIYDLFNDYVGIFQEANENNIEVIFDIQYIKNLQPQPYPTTCVSFTNWATPNVSVDLIDDYYMTNGKPITDPASGYDSQNPYLNRDPRLAASIVLPGAQYGSIVFIPANDQVPCGTRPRKYADIGNSDPDNCAINQIVLRYADVLLMRAEALIEANNLTDEVYTLINKVRQRVGMPTIQEAEGTNLSQEALRKILRHERRVELFLEGMRYVDMLRWKDESLVHDVYGYNRTKLSDPSSPSTWQFEKVTVATREFDSAKGWLWPIPLTDMQNNDQLTQNPGY